MGYFIVDTGLESWMGLFRKPGYSSAIVVDEISLRQKQQLPTGKSHISQAEQREGRDQL